MVYNWINNVQNWLLPNHCILCSQQGQATLPLCRECHNDLISIENPCRLCAMPLPESAHSGICGKCIHQPPKFDSSTCLFVYDSPISQLIQAMKFHKKLVNARLLGNLLAAHIAERQQMLPDCIIPVPLHPKRLRERGFNQSLELARPVSRALNIPIAQNLLKRVRHTPPQSRLKFRERDKNVRKAFLLNDQTVPAHIAILDDVVTTGSTCNAMAALLKKAGAETIEVWSIARSLK